MAQDSNAAVFVTETEIQEITRADAELLPITNLSRRLVSNMTSLILYGSSSVTATVPGTIYDLGRHQRTVLDAFPRFIRCAHSAMRDPAHRLMQKHSQIKQWIEGEGAKQIKLRALVRDDSRLLQRADDGSSEKDAQYWANERRATRLALGQALVRRQAVLEEVERLGSENADIERRLKEFAATERTDVAAVCADILRITGELSKIARCNEEVRRPLEREIERLEMALPMLEQKIAHWTRRIGVERWRSPAVRLVRSLPRVLPPANRRALSRVAPY